MASTVVVILGQQEGLSGSSSIADGWRFSIPFIVMGLNQSKTDSPQKVIADSRAAVIAITGDRGSSCPGIVVPYGWPPYLDSFSFDDVNMQETAVVKGKINYRGYQMTQFRIGSSMFEAQTNIDKDGAAIVVDYTYPADYTVQPLWAGEIAPTQGGLVSDPQPETPITMTFLLVSSGLTSALEQATAFNQKYVGKVNASTYRIGSIDGAARTWRCTSGTSSSTDGGRTMWYELTLTYREIGWDQLVTWIDPFTGKPPPDLIEGVGAKRPKVIPEAHFPAFISTKN